MLHLITGRTGSGKTEHILKLITDIAEKENEKVALVVPEQASFFYERKILRNLGARKARNVETLSFSRVAENVLNESGGLSYPLISDGGRIVLMSLVLENLSEKLSVYKRYIKSVSVANELLKLVSEFKRCMVFPLHLYKTSGAMESSLLKEKLSEIALIYETYDALLAQSFADDTDALTLLVKELDSNTFFSDKTVFIDSFNGFTVQEYAVIEKILVQAKDVYICLCTDSVIAENDFDPSIFSYVKSTATRLIKTAKKHNVSVASPVMISQDSLPRFKNSELSYVEKLLSGNENDVYTDTADSITFCTASDEYDECAFTASMVKRLVREENYRCRDIAVLFRNAEKYETTIKSSLLKCGLPVFEDKRQPVATQPLMVLIQTACAITANGFGSESLMRAIKTGLFDITAEETAVLENYALLWKINGERWTRDFTSSPDGYGSELTSEGLEKLEEINIIRKKATEPFIKLRKATQSADGKAISEAIYRFLTGIGADRNLKAVAVALEENSEKAQALEQERLWDTAMEILNMLAITLSGRPTTPVRYYELFNAVLSTETLGSIPQGLDEVTVGSIDRTVLVSPKAVFVLGANEGEFPRTVESSGLLSEADRKILKEKGMELYDFGEGKTFEERFLVYKTLCGAGEKLFVSYAQSSSDGKPMAASSMVRALSEKLPGSNFVKTWQVPDIERAEGAMPAFEMLCLKSSMKDGIYGELKYWFDRDRDFSQRMKALSRITDSKDFAIENESTATQLFGKNMYLSASRVEKYYNCPFSYFCTYGLNARPRQSADFDAAIQGTEIHYILEMMLKNHGKDELLRMSEEELGKETEKLLEEFLLSRMGNEEKTERFMFLYNRLKKSVVEILLRLISEFSKSSFVPVDFELKIDKDGAIMPYETVLPDGSSVRLKGFVDRVDMMELNGKKYIRIVDYKSGKKKFELSDIFNGLNMQMLLYLFAIWQNGKEYYGENIVPSGFLYMPARAEYIKQEKEKTPQETEAEKARALRMSGMILNEEAVILGMDSSVSGCFIPVEMKKNELSSDSLISLHQLSLLKKRVDRTVAGMAESLKKGKIPAYPATSTQKSACSFCDYRSVCGHEDGKNEKILQSLSNSACLERLSGEEVMKNEVDTKSADGN